MARRRRRQRSKDESPDGYWTVLEVRPGTYVAGEHFMEPGEGRIPQKHLTSTLRRLNGKKRWLGCVQQERRERRTKGRRRDDE